MYRQFLDRILSINQSPRGGPDGDSIPHGRRLALQAGQLFQGVSYEAKIPRLIGAASCRRSLPRRPSTTPIPQSSTSGAASLWRRGRAAFSATWPRSARPVRRSSPRQPTDAQLSVRGGRQYAGHGRSRIERLTGQPVGVVTGTDERPERSAHLRAFRNGTLRWLVNVDAC